MFTTKTQKHRYIGEEGVAVGVCEALRRDDYITSTHCGHGHCLAKGGSMHIAHQDMGNLGANAIVNPPQAAILSVGRIAERVVPVNGQPGVQPMMILSLSCDHRAVDGARAAQFLDTVAEWIEEPLCLL